VIQRTRTEVMTVAKWLIVGGVAVMIPVFVLLLGVASQASLTASGVPTGLALQQIPAQYLNLYMEAAATCPGLPWSVLAGIGEVETAHGQSTAAGVHSGANFAGAEGPMQFEPGTFAQYATGPDKPLSPYDPADAIFTAAAMLCANGARGGTPAGIRQALFDYNHAAWYVNEVLSWAARYATSTTATALTGQQAQIVQAAIAYAQAQTGKPYQWGAAGPAAFDCSGLVYAAYAHAGITIARTTFGWRQDGPVVPLSQIQPGDLLFSEGSDGHGPESPGHVVMYLGDDRIIQAPQTGENVQVDPLDLNGVVVATRPAALAPTTGGTP
jgi:cell wall-associated NlpC family hydrolase